MLFIIHEQAKEVYYDHATGTSSWSVNDSLLLAAFFDRDLAASARHLSFSLGYAVSCNLLIGGEVSLT